MDAVRLLASVFLYSIVLVVVVFQASGRAYAVYPQRMASNVLWVIPPFCLSVAGQV